MTPTMMQDIARCTTAVNNAQCAPFIFELVEHGHDYQDIIEFFDYWNNMTQSSGIWDNDTTYSFDNEGEEMTSGIFINMDNVCDHMKTFMRDIQVGYLRLKRNEQR